MIWGEGPRWHDGSLWLSDTQGSRLWTDTKGTWAPIDLESPSNGLWFLEGGTLVAAMMREARLGRWSGERFDTYADLNDLAPGPLGDMIGDSKGNLYVDDVAFAAHAGEAPRPGRVLLVDSDGKARVAAEGIEFPNGLALIDDEHTLVVAETFVQRLSAFDIESDGTLSGRRAYADIGALLGPEARPDGMWGVADGIWVATTGGHLLVKVRDGEVVESIDTGSAFPVACCTDETGRLFATLADTGGLPLMEAIAAKSVRTTVALVEA
jgi:sugar lactone lactonase YvrE